MRGSLCICRLILILYFILSLRRGKGESLFLREMPPRRESTIDRESVQTVAMGLYRLSKKEGDMFHAAN